MTVSELIEKLQKMPGNTMVIVNAGKNELGNGVEAEEVSLEEVERSIGDEQWRLAFADRHEDENECEYEYAVNITC